jgi:L-asparaginase II
LVLFFKKEHSFSFEFLMTLLTEILRGGRVESRHTGAFVVADTAGHVVFSGGDPDRAVFPRSAIKGLQALPLVASGAADKLGLTSAGLALACASHAGLPVHSEMAAAMLASAGRSETCLECGTHWPTSASAARALAAAGAEPSALHNNCSGKHAGFVCTAVAMGQDPAGYVRPDHPTMQAVTAAVARVTGADLDRQVPAVDGCSIPTYQIRLRDLAAGFARFGTGHGLPGDLAAAAARLRAGVAANPVMVSGEGEFDTVVAEALGDAAFVKVGAEGVYCGALPVQGLGFALKVDDGSIRAAEVAAAALLLRFLGSRPVLERLAAPVLKNWNGIEVGSMRAAFG